MTSQGMESPSPVQIVVPKLAKQVEFLEAIQVLRHRIWVFGPCIMFELNRGASRRLSTTLTLYYVPPLPH
jgi:hypothetical protein